MNENKDFERLLKKYNEQMRQLIEKNRRLRQENSNGGIAQSNNAAENEEAADNMPQATDNADETAAIPTDEPPKIDEIGRTASGEPQSPQNSDNVPNAPDLPDNPTMPAHDNPDLPDNSDNPEMPPADSFGSLAVQVTTARGAVPVADALVVISEDGEDGAQRMLFTLQTNRSGETQTVRLATYPLSLSQNPDFFGKPYKDYTITTSKPGYYTIINKNVPVFADRFSIQPVNMIALPENFNGDKTIIITERETLEEGMGGQPQTLESDNVGSNRRKEE